MSALVRPVDPAPRARKEPKPFLVTPQLMNEAAAAAAIAAFNLPAPKPPPAARCGSAGAGDDAHGPRKSGAGTPSTPTTPTTPVQEAERAGSETPDAQSGGSCSSSVSAVGRDAVLGLGLEAFDQSCAPRAGGSAAAASSRAPYQVRNLAVKAAMAPFEPAEQQQQQQLLLRQAAAAAHLAAALPREPCFSLPPPSWEAHPVPTSAPMQPPVGPGCGRRAVLCAAVCALTATLPHRHDCGCRLPARPAPRPHAPTGPATRARRPCRAPLAPPPPLPTPSRGCRRARRSACSTSKSPC
jgi:hypothetical protein